jgi:hypothetical protein
MPSGPASLAGLATRRPILCRVTAGDARAQEHRPASASAVMTLMEMMEAHPRRLAGAVPPPRYAGSCSGLAIRPSRRSRSSRFQRSPPSTRPPSSSTILPAPKSLPAAFKYALAAVSRRTPVASSMRRSGHRGGHSRRWASGRGDRSPHRLLNVRAERLSARLWCRPRDIPCAHEEGRRQVPRAIVLGLLSGLQFPR